MHPPREHRGLIVLRLGTQQKAHVLAQVKVLARALTERPIDRRLWVVEESGIREHE
jgi:hypothetical protein